MQVGVASRTAGSSAPRSSPIGLSGSSGLASSLIRVLRFVAWPGWRLVTAPAGPPRAARSRAVRAAEARPGRSATAEPGYRRKCRWTWRADRSRAGRRFLRRNPEHLTAVSGEEHHDRQLPWARSAPSPPPAGSSQAACSALLSRTACLARVAVGGGTLRAGHIGAPRCRAAPGPVTSSARSPAAESSCPPATLHHLCG